MTNKVFIASSLDGFIAGPNGEIDWLDMIPNPDQSDLGYYKFMEGIDAIVMGRKSYETVVGFDIPWPYKKPVFVLSTTIKSVAEKLKDKVEIISGSLPDILEQLHQKGHHHLYIDGGVTLQNFLKEDLIDELIITTIPILLGNGIPLFGKLPLPLEFEHIESNLLLGQMVQNHYKRKR